MILSNKRTTKALIRLRRCAGWSVPLLFANHGRQVFSNRGPYGIEFYRAREGTNYPPDATISAREFVIRDFVVSSNIAVFGNVTADGTKVEVSGAWLLEQTLILFLN